jgi:hypothetical protein
MFRAPAHRCGAAVVTAGAGAQIGSPDGWETGQYSLHSPLFCKSLSQGMVEQSFWMADPSLKSQEHIVPRLTEHAKSYFLGVRKLACKMKQVWLLISLPRPGHFLLKLYMLVAADTVTLEINVLICLCVYFVIINTT